MPEGTQHRDSYWAKLRTPTGVFSLACLIGAATTLYGAYIHYVGRSLVSDVVITTGFLLAMALATSTIVIADRRRA